MDTARRHSMITPWRRHPKPEVSPRPGQCPRAKLLGAGLPEATERHRDRCVVTLPSLEDRSRAVSRHNRRSAQRRRRVCAWRRKRRTTPQSAAKYASVHRRSGFPPAGAAAGPPCRAKPRRGRHADRVARCEGRKPEAHERRSGPQPCEGKSSSSRCLCRVPKPPILRCSEIPTSLSSCPALTLPIPGSA